MDISVLLLMLQALQAIHAPKDAADIELGRRRLAFEELLLLQLKLLLRRSIEKSPRSEIDLKGIQVNKLKMMEAGKASLGFELTAAQDRVLGEVVRDMQAGTPMMRLLQGDVGSGKTAVAVLALLAVTGSGWQGAFMAPTEVHSLLHNGYCICLPACLCSSGKTAVAVKRLLAVTGSGWQGAFMAPTEVYPRLPIDVLSST